MLLLMLCTSYFARQCTYTRECGEWIWSMRWSGTICRLLESIFSHNDGQKTISTTSLMPNHQQNVALLTSLNIFSSSTRLNVQCILLSSIKCFVMHSLHKGVMVHSVQTSILAITKRLTSANPLGIACAVVAEKR